MRACAATAEVAGEQPRTRGRSRRRGEWQRQSCVWLNDEVGNDDDGRSGRNQTAAGRSPVAGRRSQGRGQRERWLLYFTEEPGRPDHR